MLIRLRNLTFALTCFVGLYLGTSDLAAQSRFRSFNLGLVGHLGVGSNLFIDDLGNERVLRPTLPYVGDNLGTIIDNVGRSFRDKYTRQIGVRLKFQNRGQNGKMWSFGFTYTKTRVGYYFENLEPFYWSASDIVVERWHNWLRSHQLHFFVQRSWVMRNHDRSFFYFQAAGGLSMLSPERRRARKGLEDGITGNGTVSFLENGEGGVFTHQVGEKYVPVIQPEFGLQFQFGRQGDFQTLQIGLLYNLPLEPLVRTDYHAFTNQQAYTHNRINFDGEHFALTGSYSFPLKRYYPDRNGGPRKWSGGGKKKKNRDPEARVQRRQKKKSVKGQLLED